MAWEKRYDELRFIQPKHLRTRMGDPLSPHEMVSRVIQQCKETKETLITVSTSNNFINEFSNT